MIYLKAEAGSCSPLYPQNLTHSLNEHLGQKAHQGRMLHQSSKMVYNRDMDELKKL